MLIDRLDHDIGFSCVPFYDDESTNSKHDFEIGTIATSSDHWEATLRKMRLHAAEVEFKQRLVASRQQVLSIIYSHLA